MRKNLKKWTAQPFTNLCKEVWRGPRPYQQ